MTHHVYKLACPETGQLLYVGRGQNPQNRKAAFERKYDRETIFKMVRKYPTLEMAQTAELQAIEELRPPYNKHLVSSAGAVGRKNGDYQKEQTKKANTGRVMSAEARAKMSTLKIGQSWNLGRKATPEARRNMSNAHKGKKLSEETKRKLSIVRMGHPTSEQTKAKIGAANRLRAAERKARQEAK